MSNFVDEFNGLLSLTPGEFERGKVKRRVFYLSRGLKERDIGTATSS